MGANSGKVMEQQLFQLKFTSKQMSRLAAKCEKQEAAEKLKVKKSLEKGDAESARIYAQNAIRIKGQGLSYLRLSSRLDAVASRVQSAVKMQQVTQQMGQVTKGMDKVLSSMDVDKITAVMDQFEASMDNVEVRTQMMDGALNSATASSAPVDEVELLMQQVSDAHSLEWKSKALEAGTAPVQAQQAAASEEDEMERRLAALRST